MGGLLNEEGLILGLSSNGHGHGHHCSSNGGPPPPPSAPSSSSSSASSASSFSAPPSCCSSSSSSSSELDEQDGVLLLPSSASSSTDLEELDACPGHDDVVAAVKVLLQCLGEDVNRTGLLKTPVRVARAFAFATKGYQQVAKDIVGDALFPEAGVAAGFGFAGGFGGMVVVRNVDLFSLCEDCLLPFKVCCHIAYISSGLQVVGLSKLSRVADMFARRLQSPQSLADEIAKGLADAIKPLGVAVVLQSWHLPVPGVQEDGMFASFHGANSIFLHPSLTFAGRGQFDDRNSDAWSEFLSILQLQGTFVENLDIVKDNGSYEKSWCPCLSLDTPMEYTTCNATCNGFGRKCDSENGQTQVLSPVAKLPGQKVAAMVAAADAILQALGENSSKEQLCLTSRRFTRWLMNFDKEHQSSEIKVQDSSNGIPVRMDVQGLWLPPLQTEISSTMKRDAVDSSSFLCELDAPFCSLCEHHLLPFYGKAHIGYYPSDLEKVPNRLDMLKIVKVSSQRLQVQERLTKNVAETLASRFNLQSVIVVLEASHICMVSRGVEKLGSSTATVAVFGRFAADAVAKASFLKLLTGRSVKRNC